MRASVYSPSIYVPNRCAPFSLLLSPTPTLSPVYPRNDDPAHPARPPRACKPVHDKAMGTGHTPPTKHLETKKVNTQGRNTWRESNLSFFSLFSAIYISLLFAAHGWQILALGGPRGRWKKGFYTCLFSLSVAKTRDGPRVFFFSLHYTCRGLLWFMHCHVHSESTPSWGISIDV